MEDQGEAAGLNRRGPLSNLHIWEGHFYEVSRTVNNTIYLVCKYRRSKGCPGRGQVVFGGFHLTRPHTHLPNQREEAQRAFKRELFNSAITQPTNNRQVYEQIEPFHEDARLAVTYQSVQSSMFRWRRDNNPPNPDSISTYAAVLNEERWNHLRRYKEGTVNCQLVSGTDFSNSVVMVDLQFATSICGGEFILHTSAKAIPRSLLGVRQLFTLMAMKNGRVFPCIWVLMDTNSEVSYKSVFQYLKGEALGLAITKAITTSDNNLEKSLRDEFPAAEIHRSLFFQNEDVYKKIVELNLEQYFLEENEDTIKKVMRFLMALPLLPATMIHETFNDLKNSLDLETLEILENLFNYYEAYWIQGVGPENFSVFEKPDCISDVIESYNNRLETNFGTNSNTWKFTKSLMSLQSRIWNDFRRTVDGIQGGIQSPRISTRSIERKIRRPWSDLQAHRARLTPNEFLEISSYICVMPTLDHLTILFQRPIDPNDNFENDPQNVEPIYLRQDIREEGVQPEEGAHQDEANRDAVLHTPREVELRPEEGAHEDEANQDAVLDVPREVELRPEEGVHHDVQNVENHEAVDPDIQFREEPVHDDRNECCICRINESTHAFVPCGHKVICAGCEEMFRRSNQKRCPMCRADTLMAIRIF